jgi:hypothetical protein
MEKKKRKEKTKRKRKEEKERKHKEKEKKKKWLTKVLECTYGLRGENILSRLECCVI